MVLGLLFPIPTSVTGFMRCYGTLGRTTERLSTVLSVDPDSATDCVATSRSHGLSVSAPSSVGAVGLCVGGRWWGGGPDELFVSLKFPEVILWGPSGLHRSSISGN